MELLGVQSAAIRNIHLHVMICACSHWFQNSISRHYAKFGSLRFSFEKKTFDGALKQWDVLAKRLKRCYTHDMTELGLG